MEGVQGTADHEKFGDETSAATVEAQSVKLAILLSTLLTRRSRITSVSTLVKVVSVSSLSNSEAFEL